jgi:hypothetical protein
MPVSQFICSLDSFAHSHIHSGIQPFKNSKIQLFKDSGAGGGEFPGTSCRAAEKNRAPENLHNTHAATVHNVARTSRHASGNKDAEKNVRMGRHASEPLHFHMLSHSTVLILDIQITLLDARETFLDVQKALLGVQETLLDDQKALLDDRETFLDDQKALLDVQKTLLDSRNNVGMRQYANETIHFHMLSPAHFHILTEQRHPADRPGTMGAVGTIPVTEFAGNTAVPADRP